MKPVTNTTYFSIIIFFLLLAVPLVIHNVNAITPNLTIGSLGTGPGQLNLPRGIAVDDSGNIYVADNRNHRVEEFESSGKFVSEFDKGGIPEGIAIDRSGNINVVDRNNMTVEKFNPKGTLLSSFGSAGSDKGQLGNAERIAIDSSGNIYVTDVNVIQKFNPNGKFISQFFANDTQNCCMNAMGIAIDGSDNVYVADMFYNRILKFNPAGSILLSFNSTLSRQQAMSPQDVAVDSSGNIYVADTGNGRIVKFSSLGLPLSSINISGVPVGLAIDKSGKIYATDLANNRVDVFTTSQFTNISVNAKSTMPQQSEVSQNSTALSAAIKLATSSPQFQSLVNGYNYTFSSNFEESGPLSTGGIGLTAQGFAFELYSGPVKPGTAVKEVEVLEDPTLTKILNVTSYPAVYHGGVIPTNSTMSKTTNNTILSPLKQFKSGVLAKDITCNQGLKLILKAEDGSPTCVKPESVSKLLIRGWAMLSLKDFGYNPGRGPVTLANTTENNCVQFHPAPESQNSTTVPVLLMNSNSTACTRLTFTIVSNYKNCNGLTCQGIIEFNSTLSIDNLHYEKHDNLFSVSAGKDYTKSFQITVVPQTVDLENFPIGSNFTVTYIIRPLSNATGFYDQSIPKLACERYPMAVGYTADQVNYSNFSYIDPLNPPCTSAGVYDLTAVEISGMSYKEVALP